MKFLLLAVALISSAEAYSKSEAELKCEKIENIANYECTQRIKNNNMGCYNKYYSRLEMYQLHLKKCEANSKKTQEEIKDCDDSKTQLEINSKLYWDCRWPNSYVTECEAKALADKTKCINDIPADSERTELPKKPLIPKTEEPTVTND